MQKFANKSSENAGWADLRGISQLVGSVFGHDQSRWRLNSWAESSQMNMYKDHCRAWFWWNSHFLHSLASESVSILFWQITGLCHHVFWKVGLVVQNQKLWSNMTDRWFKPCWVCRKLFLVQVTVVWKWLLNTGESYLEIIQSQKVVVFSCHILLLPASGSRKHAYIQIVVRSSGFGETPQNILIHWYHS